MKALWKHIALLLLLAVTSPVFAQQVPQWSQYMLNPYIHNPAVGGSEDSFVGTLSQRYQWTGVTDAPRTFVLSLHGPTKNPAMGVGGMVYSDHVGPTRQTGGQLSYSYHFRVMEGWKLGIGLSVGALQWSIDGDKITLIDNNDPALYNDLRSKTVFDASAGIFAYHKKAFFGVSVPHIIAGKVAVFDTQDQQANQLERHYAIMAGYHYELTDIWTISPSAMVKYVAPAAPRIDLSTIVKYRDMVWLGGGYRLDDAAVIMAGYTWRNSLSVGYSYDFTTSDLRSYSHGTHEVIFSFRMPQ